MTGRGRVYRRVSRVRAEVFRLIEELQATAREPGTEAEAACMTQVLVSLQAVANRLGQTQAMLAASAREEVEPSGAPADRPHVYLS